VDKAGVEFDESFEAQRLSMLSQQFPEMAEGRGKVTFYAEDHEARLSHASWETEGGLLAAAGKSGFKLYLMELLDTLIQYRAQCGRSRWNEGILHIDQGDLRIEWLLGDDTENG
tara:strand:+ start:19783 stop:20124 length:342 start_codon:yes stop_codon:yes gene_type:complete